MENYQIYNNCLLNCPYIIPSQYLYSPIMFYSSSQTLVPCNIPNFQTNFIVTSSFAPTKDSQQEGRITTLDHSGQKSQTKELSHSHSEILLNPKKDQAKIDYVSVTNRNILPNNLNLILSYIRRVNKSGKIVEKIIKKLGQGRIYTPKKFYSYQAYLKQQVPFHKTKHTLKEITEYHDSNYTIFSYEEQKFYNKVCRILISNFLQEAYLPTLLTSSKILKTSKREHLKIRKFMMLKLRSASAEEMEPYKFIQN